MRPIQIVQRKFDFQKWAVKAQPWHLCCSLFIYLEHTFFGFHFVIAAVVNVFGDSETMQCILLCQINDNRNIAVARCVDDPNTFNWHVKFVGKVWCLDNTMRGIMYAAAVIWWCRCGGRVVGHVWLDVRHRLGRIRMRRRPKAIGYVWWWWWWRQRQRRRRVCGSPFRGCRWYHNQNIADPPPQRYHRQSLYGCLCVIRMNNKINLTLIVSFWYSRCHMRLSMRLQ